MFSHQTTCPATSLCDVSLPVHAQCLVLLILLVTIWQYSHSINYFSFTPWKCCLSPFFSPDSLITLLHSLFLQLETARGQKNWHTPWEIIQITKLLLLPGFNFSVGGSYCHLPTHIYDFGFLFLFFKHTQHSFPSISLSHQFPLSSQMFLPGPFPYIFSKRLNIPSAECQHTGLVTCPPSLLYY